LRCSIAPLAAAGNQACTSPLRRRLAAAHLSRIDRPRDEHLNVHLDDHLAQASTVVQWHPWAAARSPFWMGEYSFMVTGEDAPRHTVSVARAQPTSARSSRSTARVSVPNQVVDLRIGDDQPASANAQLYDRATSPSTCTYPARSRPASSLWRRWIAQGDGRRPRCACSGVAGHRCWRDDRRGRSRGQARYAGSHAPESIRLPAGGCERRHAGPGRGQRRGRGSGRTGSPARATWGPGLARSRNRRPAARHLSHRSDPSQTHTTIRFRHRRPHDCSGNAMPDRLRRQTVSDSAPVAP